MRVGWLSVGVKLSYLAGDHRCCRVTPFSLLQPVAVMKLSSGGVWLLWVDYIIYSHNTSITKSDVKLGKNHSINIRNTFKCQNI